MCPACLTTAALVVAGATSAGALAALAVQRLRASGARVVVTFKPRTDRDEPDRDSSGWRRSPGPAGDSTDWVRHHDRYREPRA